MADSPGTAHPSGTPAPGDRVRLRSTDEHPEPQSSGLFERWEDETGGVAKVHWDDQPFHVYHSVAASLLELEPTE